MCEHHDHRMRDAPAIERFVEWLLPKTSELVGVANLATRCGFAAGGFYPPLQSRRQSRRRVDMLVDPYSLFGKLLPFNA